MALAAKSFSDLITFTRASTAGYYGSDGLYKTAASGVARTGTYADYKPADITQQNILTYSSDYSNAAWTKQNSFVQTNLLLQSQSFDNAAWGAFDSSHVVSANSATAPDATLTADAWTWPTSTTNFAFGAQTITGDASQALTFSVWARLQTSAKNVRLKISSVTVATLTSSDVGLTTTWQRISYSIAAGALTNTGSIGVGFGSASTSSVAAGDVIELWGAQLVQGSVAGDYRATTSAALPILYADPLGTTLAMKVCEDATASVAHLISRLGATIGTQQNLSIYAKAGERTQLCIQLGSNAVYYNLSTGAIISGTNGAMESVGNGWYRCSFANVPVNQNVQIYVANAGSASYTGNGSSGIYVFGGQLNDGATALPYLATTATGGHATTTGAKRGFLVEESRTNLVLQSQTFDNASWTKGVSTVSADAATAPDGTTTADKLIVNNTVTLGQANAAGARQLVSKSAAATTYSWSVFAKAGEFNNVYLWLSNSGLTASAYARFDLSSGTVRGAITVAGSFVGVSATAEPIGGGYFRCTLVATSDTDTTIRADIWPGDSTATTGNGTSGIYVWGAQLEGGAFATTYIPTTTAQVTRAVDAPTITTVSPWYSTTEGTWYVEARAQAHPRYLIVDNSGATKYPLYLHSLAGGIATYDGANLTLTANTTTAGTVFKAATSFGSGAAKSVLNGGTVASGTYSGSFSSISAFLFGTSTGAGGTINGHLRSIRFYPRALANAELQALTA